MPSRRLPCRRLLAVLLLLPCLKLEAQTAPAPAGEVPSLPVQTLSDDGSPAPSESTPQAVRLETVVVQGEKLGRTLADTASSVSVTTGRQIENYGDESLYDLSRRVGNALATGDGGLSLRGVSQFGADNSAGAAVISTYVDGVALDNSALGGNATDAFDVEQVEILRGPQSTSQGRNALAGAVVSTTRDPTEYWDALIRARIAEAGDRQYAAAGGGPLGAGFAFRLVGQLTGTDGEITNTTRDDPDWAGSDSDLLRGKLAWHPTALPALRTLLTLATGKTEPGTDYNLEADQDGPAARRTARDNEPSTGSQRSNLGSFKAEYGFGETFTLTSTTAGVLSHADFSGDYDRTADDGGTFSTRNRGTSASQELRLNVKDYALWHDVTATGLFGVYGSNFGEGQQFDFRDLRVALSAVLPDVPGADNIIARVDGYSDSDNEGRNRALFTEFDLRLTERTTLTAGLRYDRERRTIIANSDITRADGYAFGNETAPGIPLLIPLKQAGVIPTTNGEQRATGRYHALLPKLGVRYRLDPDWTVFLTYSEAYRAGGAEVLRGSGEINEYKPEYTRNLETGFRATPWERVGVNLNLYGVRWTDQQVRVPVDGDILSTRTENAARSELYGAELEMTWRPVKGANLYASAGYAHTEFKDYVSGGVDYSGNRFVTNAPFTGSLGGSYRHASGLFGALSFSASDPYFLTPSNTEDERGESRRLLDARLGWQGRHLAIYGYGRNLLDWDYRTVSYRIEPGLGFPAAGYGRSYGDLRRFGVQLEARL